MGIIVDKMPRSCKDCLFADCNVQEVVSLSCRIKPDMFAPGLIDRMDRPEWCPIDKEIIRCKECKNYDKEMIYCNLFGIQNIDDEWFCADGVRKDE